MRTSSRARRRQLRVRRTFAVAVPVLAIAALVGWRLGSGPDQHGARVIRFTLASRAVRRSLPVVAVIPPGTDGRGRPLLVFLHGKTSDGQDQSLVSPMFAALAAQGARAPDVVFPNGGDDSYWHDRADGRWATYVLRDVIPQALRRTGADPRRIAIGGISMGGFGALELARQHPGRFCAVGGHSAALWFSGAGSAAGAFDDAQDFARHDLLRAARGANPFGRTPVWLDVGSSDPFRAADAALAVRLRGDGANVRFTMSPGDHDDAYWQSHWGSYLGFYSRALAGCHASGLSS